MDEASETQERSTGARGVAAAGVRRGLHALHAWLVLLLVATGVLLAFPDLRASVTGGYGQLLVDVHLWGGVAFALSPLLALALARAHLVEELQRRLGPPDPWGWRKTHIVLSIVIVAGLSLSGVALWLDAHLSIAMADLARLSHEVLTVLVVLSLPVHLVAARRAIVQRVQRWLGREPDVDALFDLDDLEGDDPPRGH